MNNQNFDIHKIDPGIRHAVICLRKNGIDTIGSCESGEGHAFKFPSVLLRHHANINKITTTLESNGYTCFSISHTWQYYNLGIIKPDHTLIEIYDFT